MTKNSKKRDGGLWRAQTAMSASQQVGKNAVRSALKELLELNKLSLSNGKLAPPDSV